MSDLDKYLNYPWKLFAKPHVDGKADCVSISTLWLYDTTGIDLRYFGQPTGIMAHYPVHPIQLIRLMSKRYAENKDQFSVVTDPMRGDLATWKRGDMLIHIGVYVGDGKILTSYTATGSCLVDADSESVEYLCHKELHAK